MKLILTALLSFVFSFPQILFAGNAGTYLKPESVSASSEENEGNMNTFRNLLHIHFDKSSYEAGETIWFKAYLMDSRNYLPDLQPANLYIQLYDFTGEEVLSRTYRFETGMVYGDIEIGPDFPDGNYLLKAFTSLMLNFGEDFLFRKFFYISNPAYSNRISNQEIEQNVFFNTELHRLKSELRLGIYPEGGNLLSGIENRLIIYASNALGQGVSGSGFISNHKGEKVSEYHTNDYGYASVLFIPSNEMNYQAVFNVEMQNITKDLNPVHTEGINLNFIAISDDTLSLGLSTVDLITKELILEGSRDGQSILRHTILPESMVRTIELPLSLLPYGIIYFELYDNQGNILSHRPVFIDFPNQPVVSVNAQAVQFEKDRAMNLNLSLSGLDGLPVIGELSVAVLAGDISSGPDKFDIYSNSMFRNEQSGLREYVAGLEDFESDKYFLMRDMFVLSGEYPLYAHDTQKDRPYPLEVFERSYGINLRGNVTDPYTNQPVSSVKLQLRYGIGDRRTYNTETDDNGNFEFKQLELPDSALIDITAELISGGVRPVINLIHPEKKQINYQKSIFTREQGITQRGKDWKRPRRPATAHPAAPASIYGNPDQTIIVGDRVVYFNMLELLRERATGLLITGNQIMFRGPSSIAFSNDPLFIVEDVVVGRDEFLRIIPREVQRIELFKGASAAFFGARGATGVIIAYLKRGKTAAMPFQEFMVKGFSTPDQFVFDNNKNTGNIRDGQVTTVWWEPSLLTDNNGNANLQFFLIPGVTRYKVVIQGVSKSGGVISGEFIIGN